MVGSPTMQTFPQPSPVLRQARRLYHRCQACHNIQTLSVALCLRLECKSRNFGNIEVSDLTLRAEYDFALGMKLKIADNGLIDLDI